jgi:hypothetical protein
MTMQLRPPGALLDDIAMAVQQHCRPLYALFTTYTFDANLFASQFLPILCGEFAEDDQRVGLLVVCDARSYKGHRLGPWVTTWPGTELFHPKLALLVFRKATLLFAGSGNLTDAGQYCQIEVLGKESWDRPGLPLGLVPLVSRLEGPLSKALLKLDRLRSRSFVCSLETNFAKRLKRGRVDELLVVSPFFDAHESGEPDDLGFVVDLVKHQAPKTVTLVIPVEQSTSKNHAPKVQIDPKILRAIGKPLRLYGVDPNGSGRRLHAKLLALYRKDRVRLLFGSANATTAGMTRKNVEAGWFIVSTPSEITHWFRSQKLFDRPLDPDVVQLERPSRKSSIALRSPLQFACLDQVEETLSLVWHSPAAAARTEVIYENETLRPRQNIVHGFRLGNDWFVRTRTAGQRLFSFSPIEIALVFPGARRVANPSETNPESLLEQLVAAPELDTPLSTRMRRRSREDANQLASLKQPLFERVRKLAGAMAVARQQLEDELPQRMATLALLVRIARAHDPTQARLSLREALWRYWVRVEVARVIAGAPRTTAIVEARQKLKQFLATHRLSPHIRATARIVRREVAP